MNKKILITGDNETARWHPLKGVDKHLKGILESDEITISTEYSDLTYEELKKYDTLICYTDAWKAKGTRQTAGAILSYVAGGGAVISLHSGIIMSTTPEMELMQGGRFTGHPEACDLTYTPSANSHPIIDGVESFTMFEEPYRITLSEFCEHEILMTYAHEGNDYPAAWTLPYGKGKVVYLSMGHSAKSFENEMFSRMIANSVAWCTSDK